MTQPASPSDTTSDGPLTVEPASPASARAGGWPDRDFTLLWTARAVSDLGSAVTMIALPLVAVLVLDASAAQVALIAVIGSLAGAAIALPLGTVVEYRPKRPALILADVMRAAALASVPAAAYAGVLTVWQLCAVSLINAVGSITFAASSQSHLKALVERRRLADANSRLESTLWLGQLSGPPVGGVLIGLIGPAVTLLLDGLSFLISASLVRRIRCPEPSPPARPAATSRRTELAAGWRFLLRHHGLRRCLAGYAVFSGSIAMLTPLETVFVVRDVGAAPWQYGLILGVPCAAGLVGARLASRILARYDLLAVLRWTAWGRAPWMLLLPLAHPGPAGLVLAGVTSVGLLGFSAVHNTAMTTYRQLHTPDMVMARVVTAWSVTIRATQPLFIAAGGLLAAGWGLRPALWIGGALLAASPLLLPRHGTDVTAGHENARVVTAMLE